MTIAEENVKLKEILRAALLDPHSSEWKTDANEVLKPPAKTINNGHKWEGEPCVECKHTENLHAHGGGICFSVNCSCCRYVRKKEETERC
jgi:hypothetical protein